PRRWRGRAVLSLCVVLLGVCPPTAVAQQSLPDTIVTKPTAPTSPEEAQIKAFVDQHASDLGAAEPAKIKRARQDLLEPLLNPNVSSTFRIAYAKALEPSLSQFTSEKRDTDVVAINCLFIAGELATEQGLSVVEKQLNNADAVIRYSACRGL